MDGIGLAKTQWLWTIIEHRTQMAKRASRT